MRTWRWAPVWTLLAATGCARECPRIDIPKTSDRLGSIPADREKSPTDFASDSAHPVVQATDEYCDAEPLPGPVNTAGAEDSAFWDGDTLYFFFTPDVRVPVEETLDDGVTGIWRTERTGESWTEPRKLWLFDIVSGEGCAYADGKAIWYCAVACGYDGLNWFRSDLEGGQWSFGELQEDLMDPDLAVGELHFTADRKTVIYHSDRPGGHGGLDLWQATKKGDGWGEPVNLGPELNGPDDDGFPALASGDTELWFNSTSRVDANGDGLPDYFGGIFRASKQGDGWGPPVEIVSQLSGEAAVDEQGNVAFTHHFFDGDEMLEADIYWIRRIPPGEDRSWCDR